MVVDRLGHLDVQAADGIDELDEAVQLDDDHAVQLAADELADGHLDGAQATHVVVAREGVGVAGGLDVERVDELSGSSRRR